MNEQNRVMLNNKVDMHYLKTNQASENDENGRGRSYMKHRVLEDSPQIIRNPSHQTIILK